MEIFLWIVVGAIAGSLARRLIPGPAAGGIYVAMVIGVIGAVIGGSIGTLFPADDSSRFSFFALLTATTVSLYFLFAYRCYAQRARGSSNVWRP